MNISVQLNKDQTRLVDRIRQIGLSIVAYSGGVDSAVVAQAAAAALGEQALAVTAVSPSLATGELESAVELAKRIGIQHEIIETAEHENPDYIRNAGDRCFHCKHELYSRLAIIAARYPQATLLNGTNADDLGDYRPGLKAADQHRVRSPLAELGYAKKDVRALARAWKLPVADKPASPCLSSRIAYGERVTPERLQRVDKAEAMVRREGFEVLRVRYLSHDVARIEVPIEEVPRLLQPDRIARIRSQLLKLGFREVTVDEEGFRSGKMNATLPGQLYGIEPSF